MAGANSNNGTGFRRSRGVNWTEEETEHLLEAWSDRDVQLLLENGPHNRQAFERVSFNLAQRQMDKTPSQCREKIKKLKTIYRNINRNGKVSRKVRGRLVQKLHQVMGGLPVTLSSSEKDTSGLIVGSQTVVLPNGQDEMTACDVRNHQQQQRGETGIANDDDFAANFQASIGGDFMGSGSSSSSEDESSSDDDEAEHEEDVATAASSSKNKRPENRRSSRKRARRSPVYVLMDKFIERFASLEERRLQLDKEMEEKRLEAEAKRQDAQRAHEIRLMSIMSQQMSSVLKTLNPLAFTNGRCEAISTPISVSVSASGDATKGQQEQQQQQHGGVVVNGDYSHAVHTDATTVYSSI